MTQGEPKSTSDPVDAAAENGAQESPTIVEPETSDSDNDLDEEILEEENEALAQLLEETKEALAEAEKKAAEYLDGWQRSQASFANFRKRTTAEQAQWRSTANAALLGRLVPVLDDFKRAFDAVPDAVKKDPWLSGIQLVERKIKTILETENVQPIKAEPGDVFDPNIHEAVLYQEVDGFNDGEIVAVVETGHMLADRVLRPSIVVVAKGAKNTPPPVTEESPEPEVESEDSVGQGSA